MSHIVTIKTEVRDPVAIAAACKRLGRSEPRLETVELFSGAATGWAVRLPDWRYPVVCDVERGELRFDNYDGRWGAQKGLDRFLQAYAIEKAKIEARRQGYSVIEQPLADGAIKLTIQVEGGAA